MESDVIDELLATMAIDEFMEFMSELFPDLTDDLAKQAMKQAWLDLEHAEAQSIPTRPQRFDWEEVSLDGLESTALIHLLFVTKCQSTPLAENEPFLL
jgi:hypothetical protein